MTYTEQLIGILSEAEICDCIEFEGISIVLEFSYDGCNGCVFETKDKANGCNFRWVCMAHLRKDNNSIVFAPKQEKS